MTWQECTAEIVGKIMSSGGASYVCSNVNGAFVWKEASNLQPVMIALALLFFLPAALKKLGVFKTGFRR